jgi:hypothetical protein
MSINVWGAWLIIHRHGVVYARNRQVVWSFRFPW